jgi:hypothetical protein
MNFGPRSAFAERVPLTGILGAGPGPSTWAIRSDANLHDYRREKAAEACARMRTDHGRVYGSSTGRGRSANSHFRGPQGDLPAEAAGALPDWIRGIRKAGIEAINCLMGPREFGHYKTIVSALGDTDRGELTPGTPVWLRSRYYYTCIFIQPIQPAENA